MDALVKEGIELNRAYAYHMCSPTRSSLQSGRLPLHVNVVNADPTIYDASSASGTGAGIPRNMTTIASKMRSAGYRTVMAGKWDAGMATPTHTPHGRGYDDSICYYHHGNSYWKEETGDLTCDIMVDLWDNEKPAWGQQGIAGSEPSYNDSNYEEHVFRERLLHQLAELDRHDAQQRMEDELPRQEAALQVSKVSLSKGSVTLLTYFLFLLTCAPGAREAAARDRRGHPRPYTQVIVHVGRSHVRAVHIFATQIRIVADWS